MGDYRACAGIVLFNDDGKVLLCARADEKGFEWQFVQGGIEKNEKPEEAALRELKEETSVHSAEIILSLPEPIYYDFPENIVKKFALKGCPYIGQKMYWFLVHFKGDEGEINIETQMPEFKAYRWVDISEAPQKIIYFKHDMYQKVCDIFALYIDAYVHRADM